MLENLPELTDDERKAMESIDLTDVLGTWEERHNVVMNAAKRMLRERVELKSRLARLELELEETANKLADVWLHLDSWARGEACLDFIREASASILRHQKAPGWKTPVTGG